MKYYKDNIELRAELGTSRGIDSLEIVSSETPALAVWRGLSPPPQAPPEEKEETLSHLPSLLSWQSCPGIFQSFDNNCKNKSWLYR